MYLHYYLDQSYVGAMDIEAYFDMQKIHRTTLIACTEEHVLLLGSLELVYGKKIVSVDPGIAWELNLGNMGRLTTNVFTTKKAGKQLTWDDKDRRLCV